MPDLLRTAVRSYIRRFPLQKGKHHLAEAMRRLGPQDRVVSKVSDRFLMELDLSEYIQGLLYYFGYYEKSLSSFIEAKIHPGAVMVDAGANVGTFTLLAASLGATCHAFEASPAVCATLRRNIEINRFTNVVVHECALADHCGETVFYLFEEGGRNKSCGQSALFRRGAGREIKVPMVTLDSVLSEFGRVDFIKSDVEGADFLVLEGAREILSRFHPVIAVEAAQALAEELGGSVEKILGTLWEHGYKVEVLTASGLVPVNRPQDAPRFGTLVAQVPG